WDGTQSRRLVEGRRRRLPARLAPEEGAVAERHARAVALAPARQAAGGPTRGVEAGDGVALDRQDLAGRADAQAAQREERVVGLLEVAGEGGERRLVQGLDPGRVLVEERVLALRGMAIVELDGRDEAARGQVELALDLLPGRADGGDLD